jgi:hypothetical protein
MMHRQVAAYARVSTERQAETQTIEQQIEALRAYPRRRAGACPTNASIRMTGTVAQGLIGQPWTACGMRWREATWRVRKLAECWKAISDRRRRGVNGIQRHVRWSLRDLDADHARAYG